MRTAAETSWKAGVDDNPDRFGEELGDGAHIWRVYKDVADADDKIRVENWNRGLDNLALFAGLLSAVTSAFLIEARKDLTPDPILETLHSIDAHLSNKTYSPPRPGPPGEARAVNLFWVASLILSLTAALIAIMGKDWIGMYVNMPSCTLRERADIRTFRLRCVDQWHMSGVISSAPVLLHISLLLFGAGLVVFMALDPATVIFASLTSEFIFVLYLFIIVHATLSPISPFQSPATQALRRIFVLRGREHSSQPSGKATVRRVVLNAAPPSTWKKLWPVSLIMRDRRMDEENARGASSVHSLHALVPALSHEAPAAPRVQPAKPTNSETACAGVDVHVTHDVQQVSRGTDIVEPSHAQAAASQAGSGIHLPQPIDTPRALCHWNAIPPVNPDRMLQCLVWLRAASPHAWVERAIITALGDQTIVSGTGDPAIPLRDRTSVTVPRDQILGYQVAYCLSDDYFRGARLLKQDVLLRQKFRATLPKRIDWSRTDLSAVLRYIRLRNNRPGAGMAEPEKIQLDALFRDALLEDRISPEQYIYVVCLAANRGLTIDLSKVKKHCEHIDLALTTASFLMTLLPPPQLSVKPPFDELLVMTKCFGWHRRPADAPMFATVLRTHLPLSASDSAGGASVPGPSAGDVELLSHIIGHHVGTAYSEGLYILLELLELEPASEKYSCLFDLFDDKHNPLASQAIWTICRKSPAHALSFLDALPLEELDAPGGATADLHRITRNVVVLALSWLVPPDHRFPTLNSHRKSIISRISGTRADAITTIGTVLSYSALNHPFTPVDCDWELLAAIAAYLTDRLTIPLPPAENTDERSKAESMRQEAAEVVKQFNAIGSNVGSRETGDGSAFCNFGRLLCELSRRVAFSAEIARFLRELNQLRQVCENSHLRDIMAAYPSSRDLIDQWTTISISELRIEKQRDVSGLISLVYRGTFRGAIVAIKLWRFAEPQNNKSFNSLINTAVSAEGSQLKSLHHENIILLMGIIPFNEVGHAYTVFSWAENGTVRSYTTKVPRADRLQLILDVARGLTYMHSQNPQVLHMDLHPSKVLVDSTGRALIGGFGLSIALPDGGYAAGMWWRSYGSDGSDGPLGRAPYMAPEMIEDGGVGLCSSKVDVFAWAMTALEILSGIRPLSMLWNNPHYVAYQIRAGTRPVQKNHTENLGSDAAELLGRCWPLLERAWAQSPTERPSMAEVVEELTIIKNESAQAVASAVSVPVASTSGTQ